MREVGRGHVKREGRGGRGRKREREKKKGELVRRKGKRVRQEDELQLLTDEHRDPTGIRASTLVLPSPSSIPHGHRYPHPAQASLSRWLTIALYPIPTFPTLRSGPLPEGLGDVPQVT